MRDYIFDAFGMRVVSGFKQLGGFLVASFRAYIREDSKTNGEERRKSFDSPKRLSHNGRNV